MGTSRLDSNDNSPNPWFNETATIPNGTFILDGRHPSPVNGGRVVVMFYVAALPDFTTFSGSVTIGGVSPTYSYVNNHEGSGEDWPTGVWIWMEDDIQSFSGSTIATSGTWPTTTDEHWGYCAFMNVDQDVEPAVDYQESSGTQTTIDVDTTSTSDDIIIAISEGASSTVSYTSADSMDVLLDVDFGSGRLCVAEGPGGDNTTTLTVASATNHSAYGIRLKYKKYALAMYYRAYEDIRATTSAAWTSVSADDEISSTITTAGRTYLAIFRCIFNGASTSLEVYDTRVMKENGTELDASPVDNMEARRSGTLYGHEYFYLVEYTMPTVAGGWWLDEDWRIEQRSDGSSTHRVKQKFQTLIDTSDFDTGDYYYNANDNGGTGWTTLDNTAWTDTASVTAGDGTSDWLILYAVKATSPSTNNQLRARVTINDTEVGNQYHALASESTGGKHWFGGVLTADAVATNASIVLEVQTSSSSSGVVDCAESRLAVIRLNQFEDYFGDYTATPDNTITATDTDTQINSVSHTTDTAASADWAIWSFGRADAFGDDAHAIGIELRDGTDPTNDLMFGNNDYEIIPSHSNDRVGLGPIWGFDPALADATSRTYRVYGSEGVDVSPASGADEQWMVGFTLNFAQEAGGGEQSGSLGLLGVGY